MIWRHTDYCLRLSRRLFDRYPHVEDQWACPSNGERLAQAPEVAQWPER